MTLLLIILACLLAILGVYAFMPPRAGIGGLTPATFIVAGFLALVWLVKLILLA
jgi:hypothetical protein